MAPLTSTSRPIAEDSETPCNNLWVGNLAGDVSDSHLMEIFAQYGALDSVTSYSLRSYAFVFFKRMEDAKAAKEALQGTVLHGSPIKIEFARPVRSDPCVSLGLFGFPCFIIWVIFYPCRSPCDMAGCLAFETGIFRSIGLNTTALTHNIYVGKVLV